MLSPPWGDGWAVRRLLEHLAGHAVSDPLSPVAGGTGRRAMLRTTAARVLAVACGVRVNPYRVVESWEMQWHATASAGDVRDLAAAVLAVAGALYAEITDAAEDAISAG